MTEVELRYIASERWLMDNSAQSFVDMASQAYQAGEKAWKDAVIDQLVILHVYQAKHDADPRLALKDAIDCHIQIALDPQVSSDAAALVQAGRDAMKAEAVKAIQVGSFLHDQAPTKLFANEVCKMLGELK